MPIREIIQLGEKGGDLILKKFENIRKQKEKFSEHAKFKSIQEKESVTIDKKTEQIKKSVDTAKSENAIKPEQIAKDQEKPKTLEDIIKKEDAAINKFKKLADLKNKFLKPGILKMGIGIESLLMKDKKEPQKPEQPEQQKEERRYVQGIRNASNELKGLANSASSLDPTQFTTGVIDSMKGVTQKFASAIPVFGGVISGMADYAGEMTKIGANMATNSLNAIKSAQNSAIDTLEKRGRIQYLGGRETIGQQYSLQEQSAIIEQVASKFGRFQNTALAGTIKKLFENAPDIQQATAIAAGDYKSLGTDKGYFLQQISDSLGNLPPSMGQEIQNQLLQQFVTPEGKKELNTDLARDQRQTRAMLTTQDQNRELEVSKMSKNALSLNQTLNQLNTDLTRAGAGLNSALDKMAKSVNVVISQISQPKKAGWW